MNIAHNSLGTSIHDGWMKGKKTHKWYQITTKLSGFSLTHLVTGG